MANKDRPTPKLPVQQLAILGKFVSEAQSTQTARRCTAMEL